MKMSKMYIRTLRETPAEAVLPSHILMIRTGMIRKLVSGVYGYMPLGKRVLDKVEKIVKEEMDATGAQEILMSALQPAELWQESGRWGAYGPEMWRVKDRNEREFCLGPTHEEIFTDIIRTGVSSYRQLPVTLYQIQTKYRDEARPRFGLMRSREFIMKDAYSFDRDEEGLDESYKTMYDAYTRVFTRCGLKFRPVEADTGAIGGNGSHEFTALAENGESSIVYCEHCDMAATDERAELRDDPPSSESEAMLPLEEVETPGTKTIEAVADYLKLDKKQTIKALLYETYDDEGTLSGYVAAFIRGDREANVIKLANALGIQEHQIAFADEEKMSVLTGCVGGFTGPIGLKNCRIIADSEIVGLKNLCAGANHSDHHYINVNYGRDYTADMVVNFKMIQEGDPCPVCGQPVKFTRGIEVGNIFQLGTKYTKSMNMTYLDSNGEAQYPIMGCYGIGVDRTLASIIEGHHDDKGIIWPMTVAPYQVAVIPIQYKDKMKEVADKIYEELRNKGVEVIYDDRQVSAGVMFADADLLGTPIRVIVSPRNLKDNCCEISLRDKSLSIKVPVEDTITKVTEIMSELLNKSSN